jgi:hypothetical protein
MFGVSSYAEMGRMSVSRHNRLRPKGGSLRVTEVRAVTMRKLFCKSCEQEFDSYNRVQFCSQHCRSARAPAVYRFICPDGRSYVGSQKDCRKRANEGIQRRNTRLLAAFEKHPPESFVYEVLESLPPGCSEMVLRKAEQKHINRLRSWDSQFGFNIVTAIKGGDGPAQHAALQFRRTLIERVHERARAWRYPYSVDIAG